MPASSTPHRPGRLRRPAIAAGLLLAVALAIAGTLLATRGSSHRYLLAVPDAGQLSDGDEVRVGGRRVGTIGDLRLAADRTALIDLRVDGDVAPLHRGTTATVRAPAPGDGTDGSVALRPGPNNAPLLADGARIPADGARPIADVDELLATLDAPTRASLRSLIRGVSGSAAGRGRLANAALRRLNPALRSGQALLAEVVRDAPALRSFLDSSSRIVGALALERGTVPRLVTHARAASASVLAEETALDATLDGLPGTLDRGRATLEGLQRTLGTATPLVDAALPATASLAPLLRRLRPLARDAGPAIADSRALFRRDGGGNDLVDLLRRTPALADAAVPALRDTASAATAARPVARFARPYAPDLVGALRTVSQVTAGYDANGHYARVQPIVDADAVAGDGVVGPAVRALAAALGTTGSAPQAVGARRCPGTATQPRPDGSNDPQRSDDALDCDRSAVLPGP